MLASMGTRQSDPAVGLNAAVAAELEGERAAADLTLRELAEASGVSYRTLQRLLKSRERHIDVNVLGQLAATFRTTPEAIVAAARERMARVPLTEEDEARAAMLAELERTRQGKGSGAGRPAANGSRRRKSSG